jgi:hypothetical protein
MIVTLYAKAGCHLCDEARELLEELSSAVAFDLQEVDIIGDLTLFERYRYRIPVVAIDGRETLEGRIEAGDLASVLRGGAS